MAHVQHNVARASATQTQATLVTSIRRYTMKNPVLCCCLLCVGKVMAADSTAPKTSDFLEDATLNVISRNLFLKNDNRMEERSVGKECVSTYRVREAQNR